MLDMEFPALREDPSLCVCRTIDLYLERTKPWRGKEDNQLLVSYNRPHKAVKKCTVSQWLVKVLKKSGIDTETFTAHSTRYASTLNAKALGVSLADAVKLGKWTSDSMFRKRYCKEVVTSASEFQKTLFLKKL